MLEKKYQVLKRGRPWRTAYFYLKADALYRMTYVFCQRFLPFHGDRTVDQMIQAARSGKQNIIEGKEDGTTSTEMEIKLLNVARSSLQELREDYLDYLRTRQLSIWTAGHPRYKSMQTFCGNHNHAEDYEPYLQKWDDEAMANTALTLCYQTDNLLHNELNRLEAQFVTEGGIKERMHAARTGYRQEELAELKSLREENPQLRASLARMQQENETLRKEIEHYKIELKQIAHIETPFSTKFGVPRQAGLVETRCRVVFEPEYRVAEAVRGLEGFDYVWLLWGFHLNEELTGFKPTVRPPRLGGNKRVGVFATRSPNRPNPVGLSSVRLLAVEEGPVLVVEGADLVDGTPIYDIKPYVTYADSHAGARSGFAAEAPQALLRVEDPQGVLAALPDEVALPLRQTLAQDPRPHYQDDPGRVYGMNYGGYEVKFRVDGDTAVIVSVSTTKK